MIPIPKRPGYYDNLDYVRRPILRISWQQKEMGAPVAAGAPGNETPGVGGLCSPTPLFKSIVTQKSFVQNQLYYMPKILWLFVKNKGNQVQPRSRQFANCSHELDKSTNSYGCSASIPGPIPFPPLAFIKFKLTLARLIVSVGLLLYKA